MTVEIRRAVPTDTDRIMDLLFQVEEVHRQGRPDMFREGGIKYTEPELIDIIKSDDTPVFVAVSGGDICGYVFGAVSEVKDSPMLLDMKTLHLEDVCVDEGCRGQGVGRLLVEYVGGWARENGFDRLDLDVWEFNEGARRLYERLGFSTQKRRMDMWL